LARPRTPTKKRAERPRKRASAQAASSKPRPRKRRAPEEARGELLDAAERLLSERGPDAIGLRDVASAARVSHGLITHYFKTYDGLVEAVFARRAQRVSRTLLTQLEAAKLAPSASDLLQSFLAIVREPIQLRLVAWATLSGRAQQADFLPRRERSLRAVADAIHAAALREAERLDSVAPSREDVDYALLLGLSATYAYALGKKPFLTALGRTPSADSDAQMQQRMARVLDRLLTPAPRKA
jgi:AcrR family transcriptional regulator